MYCNQYLFRYTVSLLDQIWFLWNINDAENIPPSKTLYYSVHFSKWIYFTCQIPFFSPDKTSVWIRFATLLLSGKTIFLPHKVHVLRDWDWLLHTIHSDKKIYRFWSELLVQAQASCGITSKPVQILRWIGPEEDLWWATKLNHKVTICSAILFHCLSLSFHFIHLITLWLIFFYIRHVSILLRKSILVYPINTQYTEWNLAKHKVKWDINISV